MTQQIQANSIFTVMNSDPTLPRGYTFVEDTEIGYRLNRRYNATIFVGIRGRASQYTQALYPVNTTYGLIEMTVTDSRSFRILILLVRQILSSNIS